MNEIENKFLFIFFFYVYLYKSNELIFIIKVLCQKLVEVHLIFFCLFICLSVACTIYDENDLSFRTMALTLFEKKRKKIVYAYAVTISFDF